ncbi:MAG: oligosaccharide flippase family protein [Bacteroidota bacterium]|nr:oligosaccharide flippase family protein [Rhodothermia bacterium]MCS7155412.1 oligosaccharide flippase family protein [Bacteroidota bacterium]MDW8284574.1 oligosaccharide flippase family protein [Bacteroidota bacterium]
MMWRLHQNAFLLLLAGGIRVASGFAVAVLLGRFYGAEGLGTFGLFWALYLIAFTGAGSGLKPLISRDVARKPEQTGAYLTHSLALGLFLSLILAVILALGAIALGILHLRNGLPLLLLWVGAGVTAHIAEGVFTAHERQLVPALGSLLDAALKLIGVGWAIASRQPLEEAVMTVILARIASTALLLYGLYRQFGITWRPLERPLLLQIARTYWVFAAISTASILFWQLPILLLGVFASPTQAGHFYAAQRFFDALILIALSYTTSLQPALSKLYPDQLSEFISLCHKTTRMLVFLLLPIVITGILGAEIIVLTLYGPKFSDTIPLLRLWLGVLFFNSWNLIQANALVAAGLEKLDMISNLLSLGLLTALGITLTPLYGPTGAAVSVFIGITFFFFVEYGFLRRHLFNWKIRYLLPIPIVVANGVLALNLWTALWKGFVSISWLAMVGMMSYGMSLLLWSLLLTLGRYIRWPSP